MKKNLLILTSVVFLSLSACGNNNCAESSFTSSTAASSSVPASSAEEVSSVAPESSSQEEESSEIITSFAPEYDPSEVTSFVEKKIPYNFLNVNQETGALTVEKKGTMKTYTINNETIPYVSLSVFVTEYIDYASVYPTYYNYTASLEGDVATVMNPANNTYFEFNTVTREVTYHGFDMFFDTDMRNDKPFVGGVFGSGVFNDSLTTYEYFEGEETISFNLADYGIDDYVHRGNVYLPYETLCVLFGQSSSTSTSCYAGDSFYFYNGEVSDNYLAYNQYIRAQGTDWLTSDYLLSSYNNLAFALDMHFGLDKRESHVHDGTTITYMQDGAYSLLAPYKDRLLSTDLDESNEALCDLVKNELDDGGHDKYVSTNILSTKTYTRADVSGEESSQTLTTINSISDARKAKGNAISDIFPDATNPNGYYFASGDTAYIQFDSFEMTKSSYTAEEITAENYYTDTFTLFHYANEQIQNNADIKNVIIDLAANGGGVMFASEFIASWVCGGNDGSIRNVKTGAEMNYRIEADVNFDGVFNASDYLSSDINVYVMVSEGSFSCGNKLPCNIKDNRPDNTYFIGSRSGGGSCAITMVPMGFLGGQLRISSNLQLGRKGSTQADFTSVESGVSADFYQIENTDYDAFADLSTINKKIHGEDTAA